MNNLKKLALGLLVAVLAISTQAFSSFEKEAPAKFVNQYYGWDGTEYRHIGTSFDPDNCSDGDQMCVKILDTEGTPPTTISLQDAQNLSSPVGTQPEKEYLFD